jgi:hypothetical protein
MLPCYGATSNTAAHNVQPSCLSKENTHVYVCPPYAFAVESASLAGARMWIRLNLKNKRMGAQVWANEDCSACYSDSMLW